MNAYETAIALGLTGTDNVIELLQRTGVVTVPVTQQTVDK